MARRCLRHPIADRIKCDLPKFIFAFRHDECRKQLSHKLPWVEPGGSYPPEFPALMGIVALYLIWAPFLAPSQLSMDRHYDQLEANEKANDMIALVAAIFVFGFIFILLFSAWQDGRL